MIHFQFGGLFDIWIMRILCHEFTNCVAKRIHGHFRFFWWGLETETHHRVFWKYWRRVGWPWLTVVRKSLKIEFVIDNPFNMRKVFCLKHVPSFSSFFESRKPDASERDDKCCHIVQSGFSEPIYFWGVKTYSERTAPAALISRSRRSVT
jgi:hypothetical protein